MMNLQLLHMDVFGASGYVNDMNMERLHIMKYISV